MRKAIFIDKNKLGEIKYKGSPLRQILALPISSEHQTLLLNFFSHSDIWKLSLNSIANNSFGIKKNRNRVKKSLEQLAEMGLITITNDIYAPNLDTIQSQYLALIEVKKVLKTDTQSINNITVTQSINNITDTESINDTQSITLPDTQSITLPDTQSITLPDTQSITPDTESITLPDTQSITLPDTQSITNINKLIKEDIIKEEKIKEEKNEIKQVKEKIKMRKLSSKTITKLNELMIDYNKVYNFKFNSITFSTVYIGVLTYILKNQQNINIDNIPELESIIIQSNLLPNSEINKYWNLMLDNEDFKNSITNSFFNLNLDID